MTTVLGNLNKLEDVKDSNSLPNTNPSSFSNFIDKSTIMPYRTFLKDNIKSFNLLPNEENLTKENELENSLKVKYNFDTPTLEIVLRVTTDYDLIHNKLKEYLNIFGEINSLKYDHNANNIKVNYKYYFSCLYANRSLTSILQKDNEVNSAINYYSNCDFGNKNPNPLISSDKFLSKNPNQNFTQAFKFLTENYKTNTKFKTQIYKEENSYENIINEEISKNKNAVKSETNIEELEQTDKEGTFGPKINSSSIDENINRYNQNSRTKYKRKNADGGCSNHRKKMNENYSMNNMLLQSNLFYQYLSMNNPNTIKIPIPVPVPVPIPMPITDKKINKDNSFNFNSTSFSKPKIKSSFLKNSIDKRSTPLSLKDTKMKTESNNNINISSKRNSIESPNNINNFNEGIIANNDINSSANSISKINEISSEIHKDSFKADEEKDSNSEKENIPSSNNMSSKVSKEKKDKIDLIDSIKLTEKNNTMDFFSTMEQKKLSLDRLNYFLQNNKPISNFNNPAKNLSSDENETILNSKKFPFPMYFPFPFPFQFPIKFPKFGKNKHFNGCFPFSVDFNKNIIDFNKLTLNTKNTIKFETYSSRDYYYKFVCNYLVQIENDDNFLVTKRIIGKNGCFLKKIIQEACIKFGDFSTKIRLRGKGSGYLEQDGKESEEPLMLCISSLNYPTYLNCCMLIDNLFTKIYNDYYDYLSKVLPKELHYSIRKKQVLKHEFVVNRFGNSEKNNDFKKNKEEAINMEIK